MERVDQQRRQHLRRYVGTGDGDPEDRGQHRQHHREARSAAGHQAVDRPVQSKRGFSPVRSTARSASRPPRCRSLPSALVKVLADLPPQLAAVRRRFGRPDVRRAARASRSLASAPGSRSSPARRYARPRRCARRRRAGAVRPMRRSAGREGILDLLDSVDRRLEGRRLPTHARGLGTTCPWRPRRSPG